MRWQPLAGAALAFLLATPAMYAADEPVDGPKRIFRDPFVNGLVGEWNLTRSIRGNEVHNTVKAEWVLNHQFLRIHMRDAANPPAYEALVFIGYSHADKEYTCHWLDVYGGKFAGVARGKRSGDSIVFLFQYPDGPFRNTFTWDPKAKEWTFHMENQGKDGRWKAFADDVLRRP